KGLNTLALHKANPSCPQSSRRLHQFFSELRPTKTPTATNSPLAERGFPCPKKTRRAVSAEDVSGRRALAATAHDELQVANIDEDAEGLTDDEDRILPVQRIAEQHQPAADREHPERRRH